MSLDVPLASRLEPPLTTLRVPVKEFGRISAEMLIERIRTGRSSRQRVVLPVELVVRGSTVRAGVTGTPGSGRGGGDGPGARR